MKKPASIVTLIKEDHRPLKMSIRILKSETSTASAKIKALARFLYDLKLHAKSEERSLYQFTIEQEEVRSMVLEGFEEHALADLLSAQLERASFERNWSDEVAAKAKVLAELVEHHLKAEEEIMLPAMIETYGLADLREMGRIYTATYQQLQAALRRDAKAQARTRFTATLQQQFQT